MLRIKVTGTGFKIFRCGFFTWIPALEVNANKFARLTGFAYGASVVNELVIRSSARESHFAKGQSVYSLFCLN